jgi:hypothetical protein
MPEQISKDRRARALPTTRRFNIAVFCSIIHYFALVSTVTALVILLARPNELGLMFTLGGLGLSIFTWVVAYLQRKSAYCPLCKGTPLLNSGAHPHLSAKRLFPLNHGVTAVLSIITTQKFRCMYCGADFDLLKIPHHPGR